MKWLAVAVASILLGFGLTGCGGSSSGVSHAPNLSSHSDTTISRVNEQTLVNQNDYIWTLVKIQLTDTKMLTCIKVEANEDYPVSIDCNWEVYNKGTR